MHWAFPRTDGLNCGTLLAGGADAIALKRVNAEKTEGTWKRGGKEVGKATAEVSKDGKTATVKSHGKTSDGKEFSNETVYDKQ
jgi:hypothetical protein